ncbi:GAF and ANTAR domain-containing protein [Rhodococcus sp. P1Y]|uniref:GAF and ANTAR domain-containing protein n=1 Tax=Rhodococcus sp. P1Y TaxID=1302308 RepID=UPI000EAD936F|nr:GAF and ANTAR domain-containing protein [Rhodococcus sp. P1Y]AYJ47837.1 ANTAR domain-containing protein [Rhodococcus sp. P1Y]
MVYISEQVLGDEMRPAGDTELDLGQRMAAVARELRAQHTDADRTLLAITESAVMNVPSAESASITTVLQGKFVHSAALAGDLASRCDGLQETLREGPCLESAVEQRTIRIDDMDADGRWPRFAAEASKVGVKSMICFQLYVEGHNYGALNLHSTRANAFDEDAESIGSLFAAHAAIAFSSAREEQQIRAALTTRDVIGQAKGMLMERYKLGAQAAFALLSKLSQDTNIRLADLAHQVVADAEKELTD